MLRRPKTAILILMILAATLLSAQYNSTPTPQKRVFSNEDYNDFYDCIRYANELYDDVVEYIRLGIDVNRANTWGETPLHIAAYNDRPATTELLLNSGAQINAKNSQGETPLWAAARYGCLDALSMLLQKGAKINTCSNAGMSALLASRIFNNDAYQMLIAKAKTTDYSDLTIESLVGYRTDLREMIKNGASVDEVNSYGWNPLQISVRNPNWRGGFDYLAVTMIDYSGNLEVLSPLGDNLLNLAAMGGDHWTIRHLIKKGVKVNNQNKQGETPLIQLFQYGNSSWVPLLLENGANPRLQDKNGWTPLMYAVRHWYGWDTLNRLLEAGSDLKAVNKDGKTALDIAREINNKTAIDILTGYKAPYRY